MPALLDADAVLAGITRSPDDPKPPSLKIANLLRAPRRPRHLNAGATPPLTKAEPAVSPARDQRVAARRQDKTDYRLSGRPVPAGRQKLRLNRKVSSPGVSACWPGDVHRQRGWPERHRQQLADARGPRPVVNPVAWYSAGRQLTSYPGTQFMLGSCGLRIQCGAPPDHTEEDLAMSASQTDRHRAGS